MDREHRGDLDLEVKIKDLEYRMRNVMVKKQESNV